MLTGSTLAIVYTELNIIKSVEALYAAAKSGMGCQSKLVERADSGILTWCQFSNLTLNLKVDALRLPVSIIYVSMGLRPTVHSSRHLEDHSRGSSLCHR